MPGPTQHRTPLRRVVSSLSTALMSNNMRRLYRHLWCVACYSVVILRRILPKTAHRNICRGLLVPVVLLHLHLLLSKTFQEYTTNELISQNEIRTGNEVLNASTGSCVIVLLKGSVIQIMLVLHCWTVCRGTNPHSFHLD